MKNDINLRLKTQVEELRVKVVGFEEVLQQKSADQVDLTSDMSRQYKSMQSELIQRVNELEATNTTLNNKICGFFLPLGINSALYQDLTFY